MSVYRKLGALLLVHTALLSSVAAAPPANDRFADAFTLTKDVASPGSVAEATLEPGEKVHHSTGAFGEGGTVWWKWTAPASGVHTLSASGYYGGKLLAVWTGGSAEALSLVAENNIYDSAQSDNVTFRTVAGMVYHISLAAVDDGSGQTASVNVTDAPTPPANDDFENAFPLIKDVTATGTTKDATLEPWEAGVQTGISALYTVWWRWTAPSTGLYDITTGSGDNPPLVEVWTGDAAESRTTVAWNYGDRFGRSRFPAEAGTVYHLALSVMDGSLAGPVSVKIVDSPPPPSNDDFANRAPLTTGNPWIGTTDQAGPEASEPVAPPRNSGAFSVWFTWTAPSTGWFHFVHTDPDSTYDTRRLTLWAGGSLATLRYLHGNQLDFGFKAVEGTEYQLRLAGDSAASNGVFGSGARVLITQGSAPAVEITDFAVTPSSVDVTSADRQVTVTFTMASTSPLTSGNLGVSSGAAGGAGFSAAQRISGDALQGTYSVTLEYARYRTPGTGFFVLDAYLEDAQASLGPDRAFPFLPDGTASLTLINTGLEDTEPPVLNAVSLSTAKVNLSGTERSIVVTVKAADALSGVSTVRVSLHDWAGGRFGPSVYLSEIHLIEGTSRDGTYQGTLNIPEWTAPKLYRIYAAVYDGNGNVEAAYSHTNAFPGPFRGTVLIGNLLTYPDWVKANFSPEKAVDPAVSGQSADPDNDGRTNFMEYTFASSPESRDPVSPFSFHRSEYGMELHCAVGRNLADAYHFFEQADSPEGPWVPFPQQSVGFRSAGETTIYSLGIPWEDAPKKFFRLRVSDSL